MPSAARGRLPPVLLAATGPRAGRGAGARHRAALRGVPAPAPARGSLAWTRLPATRALLPGSGRPGVPSRVHADIRPITIYWAPTMCPALSDFMPRNVKQSAQQTCGIRSRLVLRILLSGAHPLPLVSLHLLPKIYGAPASSLPPPLTPAFLLPMGAFLSTKHSALGQPPQAFPLCPAFHVAGTFSLCR